MHKETLPILHLKGILNSVLKPLLALKTPYKIASICCLPWPNPQSKYDNCLPFLCVTPFTTALSASPPPTPLQVDCSVRCCCRCWWGNQLNVPHAISSMLTQKKRLDSIRLGSACGCLIRTGELSASRPTRNGNVTNFATTTTEQQQQQQQRQRKEQQQNLEAIWRANNLIEFKQLLSSSTQKEVEKEMGGREVSCPGAVGDINLPSGEQCS